MGTLVVPGFLALVGGPVFGWAKPVPVNFNRLRNPRLGMMLVAAAGPATNLLLAALAAVLIGLVVPTDATLDFASGVPKVVTPDAALSLLGSGLVLFILINTFLALFNLLPIPPFDGSHIVEGALPRAAARQYAKLRSVGMLLFVVLIAASWAFPDADIIGRLIGPPVTWVIERFLTLSAWIAGA